MATDEHRRTVSARISERAHVLWISLTAWARKHCSIPWLFFQLLLLTLIYVVHRRWATMPVGFAIGAAGVVAAWMTVRGDRWRTTEKFLWIVIIALLWMVDVQNIFREQRSHDAEQKTVTDSLKDTQKNIQRAIDDLKSLSIKQQETSKLTAENLNQLTGGNSYCYIDFTHFVDGPRLINDGKYPLHGLSINAKDQDELDRLFKRIPQAQFHPEWNLEHEYKTAGDVTVPIGELAPYGNVPVPPLPIFERDHEKTIDIIFTSGNGYVYQHTCLKNATNSLPPRRLQAAATRVTLRGRIARTDVDQNYPKGANGGVACFPSTPN